MQTLYKNLLSLKQFGSVEEYMEVFYQLVARVDLNKSVEQMVARYINDLELPFKMYLSFTLSGLSSRLAIELWQLRSNKVEVSIRWDNILKVVFD